MRKIIYYVASSIDGYIMDSDETIEKFVGDGSGVEQYLNDLKSFDTVIMGSDKNIEVCELDIALIKQIKNDSETDIYLAGGGEFAGWLLENEQIDRLKIKLNPLILGNGVRLFGSSTKELKTELISNQIHDKGLQIIEYRIIY